MFNWQLDMPLLSQSGPPVNSPHPHMNTHVCIHPRHTHTHSVHNGMKRIHLSASERRLILYSQTNGWILLPFNMTYV